MQIIQSVFFMFVFSTPAGIYIVKFTCLVAKASSKAAAPRTESPNTNKKKWAGETRTLLELECEKSRTHLAFHVDEYWNDT
jgi:hypothetical protein